jgi:hypothetical protein
MLGGPSNAVSNRATWREAVEVRDVDTRELVDLTDHTINVEVARQWTAPWGSGDTVLSASTDDGSVAILGMGVFEFVFPASRMRTLEPGNYDIGAILTFDDETAQLLIGSAPILDGVVRTVPAGS